MNISILCSTQSPQPTFKLGSACPFSTHKCLKVALWKSHSSQPITSNPSQEIPHTLWNKILITTFRTAHHLHPSCVRWIQSTLPHPISWRSTLIYYSYPCPDLPCAVFPSCFTTTVFPLRCPMPCSALPFPSCTIWSHENVSWGLQVYSVLHCNDRETVLSMSTVQCCPWARYSAVHSMSTVQCCP